MPCYEPPPPWSRAQESNANQAAKLLCAQCRAMLDSGTLVSRPLIEWFIAHREIDLEIAAGAYYGNPTPAEAAQARSDIERARALL